jgi:hypothetical protein
LAEIIGSMRRLPAVILVSLSLSAQDVTLEHARQVNLERASNMPNFVADETVTHYITKRYAPRADSAKWEHDYTVEDEVTAKGSQITRRNVRRNGKPWDGVILGMPTTGFGAALKPLFDPQCPTTLVSAANEELSGKAALVYRSVRPRMAALATCMAAGRTILRGQDGFSSTPEAGRFSSSKRKPPDFPKGSCSPKGIRL